MPSSQTLTVDISKQYANLPMYHHPAQIMPYVASFRLLFLLPSFINLKSQYLFHLHIFHQYYFICNNLINISITPVFFFKKHLKHRYDIKIDKTFLSINKCRIGVQVSSCLLNIIDFKTLYQDAANLSSSA